MRFRGEILFARGFGLADVGAGIPCTPDTNFRLASVTKQFTAMAVMLLLQRGRLALEDNLTKLFPEFPRWGRGIRVSHLLQHTSGLPDYEDLIPVGTSLPLLDRDILRLMMQCRKPVFAAGTRYRYSNSGYALLAQIVEQRSGNTFAAFLRENIFVPLEMRGTVAYEQGVSVVRNRAIGYSMVGGEWKRSDQSLTSSVLGDGGVYSSVNDMAKWDQALAIGRLVNRTTLDYALRRGAKTDLPNTRYALGWHVGKHQGMREAWHHGETVGFTTRISRFPEQRLTIVILTNRQGAEVAALPHLIAGHVLRV